MNPLYEFDDIDDYVHGRMSESDRAAFEDALQVDADLARRVEAMQLEAKVLRMLRNEHLLAQMDAWHNTAQPEKQTNHLTEDGARRSTYGKWVIAVLVIALLGILILISRSNIFDKRQDPNIAPTPPVTTEDTTTTRPIIPSKPIAAEKNTPPLPAPAQKPPTTRDFTAIASSTYIAEDFSQTLMGTGDGSSETPYEQAVRLYEAKQYREALALLEKPDKNREQEALYLRGYTYYHLGQYAKAEADFRKFRDYDDSDRKLDAIWCEVFCLTKQLPGSRTRLDVILKAITSNPKHPYYDRAKALEKALLEKVPK